MFKDGGVFRSCFEWTLQAVEAEFDVHLAECHNVVSVLITARIVGHHLLKMELARVDALEDFFMSLNHKLWPHYAQLVRQQIDSVKNGECSCITVMQMRASPDKPLTRGALTRGRVRFI